MTIRRQMLLILGAATVLPILACVWVGFSLSRDRLQQRANQTLTAGARQLATRIDTFASNSLEGIRQDSLIPTLADYLLLPEAQRPAHAAVVNRLLRGAVTKNPIHVTTCGLLDLNGVVIADIDAQLQGQSEHEASWFREAIATGVPYRSARFEPANHPEFWVSAPVRDADGRIVGVLRLRHAPTIFQHLLSETAKAFETEVTTVLLDASFQLIVAQGVPLVHPPRDRAGHDDKPFVFSLNPDRPGSWIRWTANAQQGGSPDRIALVALAELPWYIGNIQAGDLFSAPVTDLMRAAILYTTLIVVLVIIGTQLLARRLTRPIQQLASTARRVADGDLSATLPVAGAGEVAQTAAAFNHMTTRLRDTLSSLERQALESQASERRLRELVDVSPVGISVGNARGEILQLNRTFLELFGYGMDEIRTMDDWWPRAYPDPNYRAMVERSWRERVKDSKTDGAPTAPVEATVTCKDGRRKLVEFRSSNLNGVRITVCLDLTERRRAEAALHASEERHRLLLDHAPEAVVVFDADTGLFTDSNPAAARLFKFQPTELKQHGWSDLSPSQQPDGRRTDDACAAYIGEALGGGSPVFEWTCRDRERHDIPCEVRLLRLPDAAGRRLVRGSIVDISARKHAEDTLRASEERFRLLIENSTELVAQVDLNGMFVYVSPNHHLVTGYHPEEMIGTCVFDYIHADDLASVLEAFQSSAAVVTRQFRYRFKNGSWRWFESSARRYRTSSGTEMGAVISRDITERVEAEETRKRLEAQLRQAQKLEAVGTLAGGIAHDFNNVLTGILCNTQLAEYELPSHHAARTYLAGVTQAGLRARDLVAKILTFSRRSEQQFGIHSVVPVTHEALDLLRASLPATIDIRRELEPGLQPVRCDPGQMHQVVMNLCANAAHAMEPRGGVLTVRLTAAVPGAALITDQPALTGRSCVRLQVIDTGKGMDAATRERIFEPFFTTKPIGEGTGLGLAVVHGIVEDHGGAITVDSTPGVGTTFDVWLPVVAAPETTSAPGRDGGTLPKGRGERVLVVDDEPEVSQAGARILERLGYRTAAFTQSKVALEEFRRDPKAFDAVLSDLTMPELTGADFVKELLAIRPNLPVLIATGYMRSLDVENARSLGVRDFLQKPFTIESLATTLRRTLDRK